jgi:hypothetical protein
MAKTARQEIEGIMFNINLASRVGVGARVFLRTAVLAVGCLAVAPSTALAFPNIANDWEDYYGPGGTSGIGSNSMINMNDATGSRCQVCHVESNGGEPWNAYGWALREAGAGGDAVAAFMAVEGEDSDGNGDTNLEEIASDAQPGWTTTGNLAFAPDGTEPIPDGNIPGATPLDPPSDSDGDGVGDDVDNCIAVANPDQRDSNGDGFGNRCDADLNGDCVVNPIDLGIFRSVFFTSDPDADLNGDGVVNPIDLGIFRSLFFLPPGPSALASCT